MLALGSERNRVLEVAPNLRISSNASSQFRCALKIVDRTRNINFYIEWDRRLTREQRRLTIMVGEQLDELVQPLAGELLQPASHRQVETNALGP